LERKKPSRGVPASDCQACGHPGGRAREGSDRPAPTQTGHSWAPTVLLSISIVRMQPCLCLQPEALLLEHTVLWPDPQERFGMASSIREDHVSLRPPYYRLASRMSRENLAKWADRGVLFGLFRARWQERQVRQRNGAVRRQVFHLTMTCPASATRTWPVIVRALSEQRNTTASAMSWPLISRRSAVLPT